MSPAGLNTATPATCCFTRILELATSVPTTAVIVVNPAPRAITAPSAATVATLESPVVQVGCAPTRMLPLLSATVAAKWIVSPIALAVSIAGRSLTHAAPRLPIDWCDSELPITPYENSAVIMLMSAAPVDAMTATPLLIC